MELNETALTAAVEAAARRSWADHRGLEDPTWEELEAMTRFHLRDHLTPVVHTALQTYLEVERSAEVQMSPEELEHLLAQFEMPTDPRSDVP